MQPCTHLCETKGQVSLSACPRHCGSMGQRSKVRNNYWKMIFILRYPFLVIEKEVSVAYTSWVPIADKGIFSQKYRSTIFWGTWIALELKCSAYKAEKHFMVIPGMQKSKCRMKTQRRIFLLNKVHCGVALRCFFWHLFSKPNSILDNKN